MIKAGSRQYEMIAETRMLLEQCRANLDALHALCKEPVERVAARWATASITKALEHVEIIDQSQEAS